MIFLFAASLNTTNLGSSIMPSKVCIHSTPGKVESVSGVGAGVGSEVGSGVCVGMLSVEVPDISFSILAVWLSSSSSAAASSAAAGGKQKGKQYHIANHY